jgi:hypothetical protein
MSGRSIDWHKQARFGTLVLLLALAWAALNPALEQSHPFVVSSYFLLGALAAFGFQRRVAFALILPLVGALLPELLQALVPARDTRGIELLVKWMATSSGTISGLLGIYISGRLKGRSLNQNRP